MKFIKVEIWWKLVCSVILQKACQKIGRLFVMLFKYYYKRYSFLFLLPLIYLLL